MAHPWLVWARAACVRMRACKHRQRRRSSRARAGLPRLRPACLFRGGVCQGPVKFWDEGGDIEPLQTGPFPVGTRVRIQTLENDPMNLSGKVGTIAWIVPGGASVAIDGLADKVKVQDEAMIKELGVHCEVIGEQNLFRHPGRVRPLCCRTDLRQRAAPLEHMASIASSCLCLPLSVARCCR